MADPKRSARQDEFFVKTKLIKMNLEINISIDVFDGI
jgi:hypothetical protein